MARLVQVSPKRTTPVTETSAMVSIEALLRDHEEAQARALREAEAEAMREAAAQADAHARARAELEERARAEEAAAEARAREEARHAAELVALREAAVARALVEAQANERLLAAAARDAHARELAKLATDRGKRRWKVSAVVVAFALAAALAGGGAAYRVEHGRQVAATTEADMLRSQLQGAEGEKSALDLRLKGAHDPETIARLKAEIDAKQAEIDRLRKPHGQENVAPQSTKPVQAAVPVPTTTAPSGSQYDNCTCMSASDPFCDHTRHCKILHP